MLAGEDYQFFLDRNETFWLELIRETLTAPSARLFGLQSKEFRLPFN